MESDPPLTQPATAESITEVRVNREYSVLLSILNDEMGQLKHTIQFLKDEKLDSSYELYTFVALKRIIKQFKKAYGDAQ